jgi:hypothetical protein
MEGIYNYILGTNHVFRAHNFTAILRLQYRVLAMPASTFAALGAKCYAGPGHKHNDRERKGENVKFVHIGYKSYTVAHHK